MRGLLVILFAVCVPCMSAGDRHGPSSLSKEKVARDPNLVVPFMYSGGSVMPTLQSYPSIEAIVRAHLRPDGPPVEDGTPITEHHLLRLAALTLRQQALDNFAILGGLQSLRMYGCRVTDFASIKRLPATKELHVRDCAIRDISALANLLELVHVSLTNNQIEDITPLSKCQKLTWLDLRDNRIKHVSALKALHELTYVDLRNNPLEAGSDEDVVAIKTNNPGVRILIGPQSGTKEELKKRLAATAVVAEFALCARLRYEEGIVYPSLPGLEDELPEEVVEALKCLAEGDEKEYLSDIAGLLMKYTTEMENYYRPGGVWDPNEPLIAAFFKGVGVSFANAVGVPGTTPGYWILANREKLSPSVFLDIQIERYYDSHRKLVEEGIFNR